MKIEDIKIDKEFKNLLPGLTDDELKQLKNNIVTDGEIRDPLIVWNGVLVDGHNRLDVWNNLTPEERRKVQKPYIQIKPFDNREQAEEWMILKQLGQRNIDAKQRSILVALEYELKKKNSQDNLKKGENAYVSPESQIETSGDTATEVAEEVGQSRAQVFRDTKFKKAIDLIEKHLGKDAKKELLDKKNKVSKAKIFEIAKQPVEKMQAAFDRALGRGTPSGGVTFEPGEWSNSEEPKPKPFDDSKLDKLIGQIARLIDQRFESKGGKSLHGNCIKSLRAFNADLKAWRAKK